MWLQFLSQNAHFVVHLFAALVAMGICWLYVDAWMSQRNAKEFFKWIGFGLLSVSFLLESTLIEQSILGKSLFGHWASGVSIGVKFIAYGCIIVGQLIDPLQTQPKNLGIQNEEVEQKIETSGERGIFNASAFVSFLSTGLRSILPLGAILIAGLYWRRATKGLERHYKPVARAFIFFALSDITGLSVLLRSTTNPLLYTWVAAFGWIWWAQLILLGIGVAILGFWTWGYLLERFFSQLFMIMVGMVVLVFTVVSVGFTGLLLKNIEADSIVHIQTAAKVLNYALLAKESETTSAASELASKQEVISSLSQQDRSKLLVSIPQFMVEKKLTGLIITNQSGQVIVRGQDTDLWGDSISNDILVRRSLVGLNESTIRVIDGVSAPVVQVQSAVAVKNNSGQIVGSVITTLELNSVFTDGIKQSTGLQSSVYGGVVLASTTLTANDGRTRPVGVKITNAKISEKVLKKGMSTYETITLQQREMLAAFEPLKDIDNTPVGMLMVAEPKSTLLKTAGHSVELTFILSTVLLLLSIAPIVVVTKNLVRQVT